VVNAFEDEMSRGREIVAWIDRVRVSILESIVIPILVRAAERTAHEPISPPSEWGEPGDVIEMFSLDALGERHSIAPGRFKEDAWRRALGLCQEGDVTSLNLDIYQLDEHGLLGDGLGQAHLVVEPGAYGSDIAHEVGVITALPAGEEIPPALQGGYVTALKSAAVDLSAITGYVTLDTTATPYEDRFGISTLSARPLARDHVRGYYWAMLLGPEHIARLGGPHEVNQAPCRIVETLSEDSMYLQLTEDVNSVTESDLQMLRDFLAPVLIPHDDVDYAGPPLRGVID
jgi:hypothetical protein